MLSCLRAMSLSQRLLIGALIWVLCSVVVAGLLLNQLFQQSVEQQLQKELTLHMQQLITQIDFDENQSLQPQLTPLLSDPRFEQPLGGLYWQISANTNTNTNTNTNANAMPALYSRSLWDEKLTPPWQENQSDTWQKYLDPELGELYLAGRIITFTDEAGSQSYQFWVAAQGSLIAEPLQRFISMLVLTLAVLGAVLVVGVWWQLRLGLQPLRRLRQGLVAVHEGQSATLEGQYPQEIQPLVSEFNRVLQSNAQVLERARTQAGNLAHAIKTPLAVLANAAKKDEVDLASLVLTQVASAQEQVDYQLSRARVAAAVKTIGVRTAVMPAVSSLSQLLQRAYEPKSVVVNISADAPTLYIKGEAQDVHEMLGNLLDNAFKWCRHRIDVTVTRTSLLCIVIDDDGLGLAPEQYETVFKRGVRADEMVPGSGLGLAIVADLVQLYGGEVSAAPSPLGGLRVALTLP